MSTILIQNGTILDPSQNLDGTADLLIQNGKILEIGKQLQASDAQIIDATGLIVAPGFIDLHVHLREPGQEYKETIETGTKAAAAGGFTSVCCMANTDPVNDHPAITESILYRAQKSARVNVFPIGAITKRLEGKELAEIGQLKAAGCVAISDDGKTLQNSGLMRIALEYAKSFHLPVVTHCLCPDLSGAGVMNEGWVSTELGLKGIPHEAEEVIIARDIALARRTGCHVHIAHVSTLRGVELLREAKARGWPVSGEAAPHHFTLTDEACRTYDPNTKMAPPLRTQADIEAIEEGLKDGSLDVIATDHAPHSIGDKEVGFEAAPCGILGLETALPLSLKLVKKQKISLKRLVELLSTRPSQLFQLNRGTLKPGSIADVTVFSADEPWVYRVSEGFSKSRNSPFDGWKMEGRVKYTMVSGKITYQSNPL